MRKPDFFIVGAPKCGTTAMNHFLGQHPEIFVSWKKEAHFFGSDLNSPWFLRDERRYLSLFSKARNEKRVGETSVWYLYSRSAASEINAFADDARIIIMLRDPVEMIHAQHSQFLYNGNEDIEDFRAAVEAEEDRKQGRRIPKSAHFPEGLFYRETARFATQIERYLDVFGRQRVHILLLEDFRERPGACFSEMLRFLEVDDGFRPDFRIINPNKELRSPAVRRLLQDAPRWTKQAIGALLPDASRHALSAKIKRLNTRYARRRPLEPSFERLLRRQFEPEVRELEALLGRDLSHWCADAAG